MTYRQLLTALADEYRSRYGTPAPGAPVLLRESWVPRYLAVMWREMPMTCLPPARHPAPVLVWPEEQVYAQN